MIAFKIKVKGKVQGVFYRKYTVEKAQSLSLCGWVKNREDGSVEIFAEGDKQIIDMLISWCKTGPKNAVVMDIDVSEVPLQGYSDFRIIHN